MKLRLILLAALLASACGGGGGSPTSPSAQPFNQTIAGTVGVFGTQLHALTASRSGVLTARLSWTASADLDLYLASSACSQLYPMSACAILARADGSVNPETVTRTVTNGESLKIFVDNLSLSQSASYTLTLNIQ